MTSLKIAERTLWCLYHAQRHAYVNEEKEKCRAMISHWEQRIRVLRCTKWKLARRKK